MLDDNTIDIYRKEFPVVNSLVYMDHAGVAPVSLRVKNEVEGFLSRASDKGIIDYDTWMNRVEEVRAASAALIGSQSDEIAFVKNTSHGISLVSGGLEWNEGDNVIISDKEFPSNVYPWLELKRKGVEVRTAPFIDGEIRIEDIEGLIDPGTRLISISSVQSLNGFRIDLKRLGELCRASGVLFFVDAIQSLGVVPMDVKECGADFLAADGHKWLLAPEGTGIFYCKKELAESLNPLLIGWNCVCDVNEYEKLNFDLQDNARRFEEGSFSTMGIYALGASIDMLSEIGVEEIMKRVLYLGDMLISEADKRGLQIKTPLSPLKRGGIVSIAGDFDPASVRDKLMEHNIVVNHRGGALRVAPHFYNTEDEIVKFFSELDKIIADN